MNWISIIVIAFWLLMIVNGIRLGFIKTVISMVSILLAIFLSSLISPYVSGFIEEKTPIYEKVENACEKQIAAYLGDKVETDINIQDQISAIETLPLPEALKDLLVENNTAEGYSQLVVGSFAEYLSTYLAQILIRGMASVLSFALALILIRLLAVVLDGFAQLPVISTVNRIAGGVLGLVKGLLLIWILFIILTVLCNFNFSWGEELYQMIRADRFLNFLYNTNVLQQFMNGFLG